MKSISRLAQPGLVFHSRKYLFFLKGQFARAVCFWLIVNKVNVNSESIDITSVPPAATSAFNHETQSRFHETRWHNVISSVPAIYVNINASNR